MALTGALRAYSCKLSAIIGSTIMPRLGSLSLKNVGPKLAVADQLTRQSSSAAKVNNAALLLGDWYNELGSMMTISEINKEGHLTGFYETAVGRVTGEQFELVGDVSTTQKNPTFGMTVVWKQSTTCWVGQYYEIDDNPTLLTTWILRDHGPFKNDWESTLINKDKFTRVPQS